MKLFRIVASIVAVGLLSVGATAAHAQVIPADLPMNSVSPVGGSTISSPYPNFVWELPAGAQNQSLVVSASPKLSNPLPEYPDARASSLKSQRVYSPGTYYWQVTAQDDVTAGMYISPVQKFVVPTVFVLTKFKAKIAKNGANNISQVEVNGVLKCSVGYTSKYDKLLTIQVFKGKKKIGSQERLAGDCNSMTRTKEFANWQPKPGSIKKGTKLTVKVFASFGKQKSDVQVLKVTWK